MNVDDYLHVAAYQGNAIDANPEESLAKTLEIMEMANAKGIDILCMPECFLHGYFEERELAEEFSIDLESREFAKLCEQFKRFNTTTLILGLNERIENKLYNTAVVIESGRYLGKYRKCYTYAPYMYYSLGNEFPIFIKKGIKYGIIICLDNIFREPAYITALKGARILFCPMFNRVPIDAPSLHFLRRRTHMTARAYENHCWLVCSDIIWDHHDDRIGSGYASIFNDDGELICEAIKLEEMLINYSIPINNLKERKLLRLMGRTGLFDILKQNYQNTLGDLNNYKLYPEYD